MPRIVRYICLGIAAAICMLDEGFSADLKADGLQGSVTPPRRELIYGAELMTHEEREQYRERMRGAKTPDAEARIRAENYGAMQKRARVRGVKLPEPTAPAASK